MRRSTGTSAKAAELVHAYGREAVSPTVLLPGLRRDVSETRVVGFVEVAGARVFAGSAIEAPAARAEVGAAPPGSTRRSVVFGRELEEDEPVPHDAYVVGEQPWWDLAAWPATLRAASSLRAQIRRAAHKGVRARARDASELAPGAPLRVAADALVERWMRSRAMPPLAFVATVAPFFLLAERRVFVAEVGPDVVGILFAIPIAGRSAWLLDHIVRAPTAPNGTTELLVDLAMRALAAEGAQRATLGLCPLAGRVAPPLALVRRMSRGLFDFQGLHAFKAKLKPQRWQRVLVEHPGQTAVMATVRALRAFAGGSLACFGLRAALRGPPPLLRLVALLLVPWTVALAHPEAGRFFPRPWMRLGWIALDLGVAAGLVLLAQRSTRPRPRRSLHRALAVVVTADALATTLQALTWNAHHARGLDEVALTLVACLAPWTLAVVLWSALRYR